MRFRLTSAAAAVLIVFAASAAAEQPPSCKPVEHYGVKGCEILPDQTCPPGYHKKVVDPPNPRMTTPSYLMCVPDKPQRMDRKPTQAPSLANQGKKS